MKKSGFTLVELSIVLVIIGLLIGGILVGQSLIDSSRIGKEIRQLQQYSIAFYNFRDKFKQEAGDSNILTAPGNNDGDTYDQSGTACTANHFPEPYTAWAQLYESNMVSSRFVWDGTKGPSCGSGSVYGVTPSQLDNKFYAMAYGYDKVTFSYGGKSFYRRITSGYMPQSILAIDAKIDDGIVSTTTGIIQSYDSSYSGACTLTGTSSCPTMIFFAPSLSGIIN